MKSESHFVNYYAEERGETVIYTDKGFISYKIYNNTGMAEKEIMICDFFVEPEFRGTIEAKKLADTVQDIGRREKCTHMSCYIQHTGSSELQRKRTTYKLKLFIHYGMIIHSMNAAQILMYKNL